MTKLLLNVFHLIGKRALSLSAGVLFCFAVTSGIVLCKVKESVKQTVGKDLVHMEEQ